MVVNEFLPVMLCIAVCLSSDQDLVVVDGVWAGGPVVVWIVCSRMATADSLYCTVPGMEIHMEHRECRLKNVGSESRLWLHCSKGSFVPPSRTSV